MNAIEVDRLTKIFRLYNSPKDRLREMVNLGRKQYHHDFYALNDVSFQIKKGETVGIIGQNGSGKSTLLKIICGVLQPTTGIVKVAGRISSLLELGAGFNPEFTGRENVYMNGALMGLSRKEIDHRFREVEAFADIGEYLDQPVKTYSSGMYVRLAFAVAIHVDPEILVIDEALAVGDTYFQAKCISKIHQLKKRGITILLVTHDLHTVKSLCSKCLYLMAGASKAFGLAKDVADVYLRNIRETINKQKEIDPNSLNVGGRNAEEEIAENDQEPSGGNRCAPPRYKENHEFMKRAETFRYGSGEVTISNVELLSTNGDPITEVEFGQNVVIRIHLVFNEEMKVSVAYHIRDDKHIGILMCSTVHATEQLIHGQKDERYVIDFETAVPLSDGAYNLLVLINSPIIRDKTATTIDFIENAFLFSVRERRPVKVWAKVYLENRVSIVSANP